MMVEIAVDLMSTRTFAMTVNVLLMEEQVEEISQQSKLLLQPQQVEDVQFLVTLVMGSVMMKITFKIAAMMVGTVVDLMSKLTSAQCVNVWKKLKQIHQLPKLEKIGLQ